MASENPDDRDTIPLYEQIYALAGLAQYYRITQDWEVLEDIRRTMNSFQTYYLDSPENYPQSGPGGISPISTMPLSGRIPRPWVTTDCEKTGTPSATIFPLIWSIFFWPWTRLPMKWNHSCASAARFWTPLPD